MCCCLLLAFHCNVIEAAGSMPRLRATAPTISGERVPTPRKYTVDEVHMQNLIKLALAFNPGDPFAASIVDTQTNELKCLGINNVKADPTLHGEIAAINNCSTLYGFNRTIWHNWALYTTAESCPMCQSAIEWASLGRVVYGTSIPFLQQHGWRQIDILSREVNNRTSFNSCEIVGGVLEDECNKLFADGPADGHSHAHSHDEMPL